MVKYSHCDRGGTAYTTDLKSVGETLRVQIPPVAPKMRAPNRGSHFWFVIRKGFEAALRKQSGGLFLAAGERRLSEICSINARSLRVSLRQTD